MRLAIKLSITAILLLLVLRSVEPARLLNDLGKLQAGRLALLLVCVWIGQLACAQRWRLFAAALGLAGKYPRFVQMYFVCMFFNIGLPSLIGGDAIKAYMVSRGAGKPLQLGAASVLQDRAAGWITLILYGSAAAVVCPLTWRNVPLLWMYVALWIGVAASLLLVWKGAGLYPGLLARRRSPAIQKTLSLLADFHEALATLRLSGQAIFQISLISFFNSALALWIYQQIAVSAGQNAALVPFSAVIPIITLLVMMPISLGGLGIREWAYIEALGLLGIPRSAALATALTTSAVMIAGNLAGALFLPSIPRELRGKEARRAQRRQTEPQA